MESSLKGNFPNPLSRASFLSRVTFWWMNGLFSKGYDRRLEPQDLYEVIPEDSADLLVTDLECEWQKEHSTAVFSDRNVSLERVLLKSIRKNLLIIGIWGLLNETMRTVQPVLLLHLLSCFEDDGNFTRKKAYMYAAGLMVSTVLSALFNQLYFFTAHKTGMRLQIAITGVIYRKALRLSHSAREKVPTDHVVDLISNDAQKFDLCALLLHYLWIAPLQMIVTVCLLWQQVGVSCLVGCGLLLLMIPLQVCLDNSSINTQENSERLAEERRKHMNEILSEVRFIKMNTWEIPFSSLINNLRSREISTVRKASFIRGLKMAFDFPAQVVLSFGIFITFVLLGNRLTAAVIFSTIAFINAVQRSMAKHFPLGAQRLKETKLSIKKIQDFLELEELGLERITKTSRRSGEVGIKATDISASWDKRSGILAVQNISFDIRKGDLLMVVGQSGAGKSSLLMSLLGELTITKGHVEYRGRMSYAPQRAWVFSGTVRQNILFGEQYDEEYYWTVVRACALEKDVDLMPEGDLTLVGLAALSLSEAQKTKISLARAVYHKADIFLLDDPLTSVDPLDGRHLFDECITGLLSDYPVILVTNQLQHLRSATQVLCLQEGCVVGQGSYTELARSGLDLRSLMPPQEEDEDRDSAIDDDSGSTDHLAVGDVALRRHPEKVSTRKLKSLYRRSAASSVDVQLELNENEHVLGDPHIELETRPRGDIPLSLYAQYFSAGAHCVVLCVLTVLCITAQAAFTMCEWWLACWSQKSFLQPASGNPGHHTSISTEEFKLSRDYNIAIYGGLVGATVLLSLMKTFLFLNVTVNSSRRLHDRMFNAILRAPMYFFDTNPVGRILNRFSCDIGYMDNVLPEAFIEFVQLSIMAVAVVVVNVISIPWVLIGIVPLFLIFYWWRNYYLKTAREIKRLEGTARFPVLSHVCASLDGLSIIRALKCQGTLMREFSSCQDQHTESHFLFLASSRWLAFRLDVLCLLFLFMASFAPLFVTQRLGAGNLHAGIVALALTYALRLTGNFQLCVRESAEVQSQMTSVERVMEYCQLDPEGEWHVESDLPPHWPYLGLITGEGLSFQYHPTLPRVLRNLYFCIRPKEKVGIVGRTGAGKSSLLSALFRLEEPKGSIRIDGIDVTEIGLHDLRRKISVIPPEPALFSTTLRYNLDPCNEHSDESIRQALREVNLLETTGGLDKVVQSCKYSIGQRRLLCLARAILRHNKILILDEGSESIDQSSDAQIQEIIRRKFVDCTVVTITQRLDTVMDSDRVMVMDGGRLREVDEPHVLLENKDSLFTKLVEETGTKDAEQLSGLARRAHDKRNRPQCHASVPDSERSHLASYIPHSGYTDLQLLTLV